MVLLSTQRRGEDGLLSYDVEKRDKDKVAVFASCEAKSFNEIPEFRLDQALDAVYNIYRGQRCTVEMYATPFLDRYPKTFFHDGYRFSVAVKQSQIMSITAIGNYYNHQRWGCGLVEDFYDAYRLLRCTYARALLRALELGWLDDDKRGEACVGDKPENARQYAKYDYYPSCSFITVPPHSDTAVEAVREAIPDLDSAMSLLEGVFICAYVRDHTATSSEMKTAKEKAHFARALEAVSAIDGDDPMDFYTVEHLRMLVDLGRTTDTILVIPAGENEPIDVLDETIEEWRERTGTPRPTIKEDDVPITIVQDDKYKMTEDERAQAAARPRKRGRKRKTSAVEEEINSLSEIDEVHVEDIAPQKL